MRYLKNITISWAVLLWLPGCYYDKSELLYPSTHCDTVNISYNLTVKPIIVNYCLACHGANNHNSLGGNLNLDGYNNIITVAKNGVLVKSIRHEAGVSPMPKNSPALTECHILKIEKWISSGATNN